MPQQVPVWTGDDPGDILLAGCLHSPGSLDFGERYLFGRGRN